jgi:non-ribosomal peptide synthetase component F
MALLAGFKASLAALTRQTDLRVGSPGAFRGRPELEGLIGLFLEILVLRTDLGGDPTFREALARVRETALGAYAHDLPFAKVQEAAAGRDTGEAPLYEVWFVLQNQPTTAEIELPGLRITELPLPLRRTKFDLAVNLVETAHGVIGQIEYATDLFDAATAARIAAGYRAVLEGAVAEPGARLSGLAARVAETAARQDEDRRSRFVESIRSTTIRGARRSPVRVETEGELPT